MAERTCSVVDRYSKVFPTLPALCSVEGCARRHHADGFCDPHRSRWARGGCPKPAQPIRRMGRSGCLVGWCRAKHYAHGLCRTHHQRCKRYGVDAEWLTENTAPGTLCQACREAPATDIDHCHETGVVRGYVCHGCNAAEGMLGTPERARRLAEYMEAYS